MGRGTSLPAPNEPRPGLLACGAARDLAIGDRIGMASLRRMTSNIAAQVFGLAASMIDRVVLVGLLLRHWGADVFSDYAVIQSAASLLLLSELGLQLYVQNVQQAAFVAGDRPAFRRLAGIHLGVILALVTLVGTALAFAVTFGGTENLLQANALDAGSARRIFLLLGVGNLLNVVRSTTTTIYTAAGDFSYVNLITAGISASVTIASAAAVALGAGPVVLAWIYCGIGGIGGLGYCLWDIRRRYPAWIGVPAVPHRHELRQAVRHVKWYGLAQVSQAVWSQIPVLVLAAWHVAGGGITAFLLIRTLINLIRQFFQFAAVGAGLEIATLAHAGDVARAWQLSARVGLLTTILSAAAFAAVLCFGRAILFNWTSGAVPFSPHLAVFLLAPLLLVAPLQQPFALLQYANLSLVPGLQRLLQLCLGPLFCIAGQAGGGIIGLVIGLALAEILSCWSVVPLLARMPMFTGLAAYCSRSLAAALGAAGLCTLAGFGVTALLPASSLVTLAAGLGLWTLVTVVPIIVLTLPGRLRGAALAQATRALSAGWRSGRKPGL